MLNLFKRKQHEPTIFDQKPAFKTTVPTSRPSFNEWAKEYRVSSCYERTKYIYIQVPAIL